MTGSAMLLIAMLTATNQQEAACKVLHAEAFHELLPDRLLHFDSHGVLVALQDRSKPIDTLQSCKSCTFCSTMYRL